MTENIGIHGRTVVVNAFLMAKLSKRASVNGISSSIKNRIKTKIKDFIYLEKERIKRATSEYQWIHLSKKIDFLSIFKKSNII